MEKRQVFSIRKFGSLVASVLVCAFWFGPSVSADSQLTTFHYVEKSELSIEQQRQIQTDNPQVTESVYYMVYEPVTKTLPTTGVNSIDLLPLGLTGMAIGTLIFAVSKRHKYALAVFVVVGSGLVALTGVEAASHLAQFNQELSVSHVRDGERMIEGYRYIGYLTDRAQNGAIETSRSTKEKALQVVPGLPAESHKGDIDTGEATKEDALPESPTLPTESHKGDIDTGEATKEEALPASPTLPPVTHKGDIATGQANKEEALPESPTLPIETHKGDIDTGEATKEESLPESPVLPTETHKGDIDTGEATKEESLPASPTLPPVTHKGDIDTGEATKEDALPESPSLPIETHKGDIATGEATKEEALPESPALPAESHKGDIDTGQATKEESLPESPALPTESHKGDIDTGEAAKEEALPESPVIPIETHKGDIDTGESTKEEALPASPALPAENHKGDIDTGQATKEDALPESPVLPTETHKGDIATGEATKEEALPESPALPTESHKGDIDTGEAAKEEALPESPVIPAETHKGDFDTGQANKEEALTADPVSANIVDVRSVARILNSLDFKTDSVVKDLLQPTFKPTDYYFKKREMMKTKPAVTDEEVAEALRIDYLERLSVKETVDASKKTMEESLRAIAIDALGILGDSPENRERVIREIETNKEKLLLGLTYLNRFYDIQFGDTNLKKALIYHPSSFGKDITALQWLTRLGSMSYEEMKLANIATTFETYFREVTDKPSLKAFLEANREALTDLDGDAWLKQASRAIIVEKASASNSTAKVGLYTKLTTSPTELGVKAEQAPSRERQNMATLIGLLTIKDPSVYAISTMTTTTYGTIGSYMDRQLAQTNPTRYQSELEKVTKMIEDTATRQAQFTDTLYRLTKAENQHLLVTNRMILDTMKQYSSNPTASVETTWSKEFGQGVDNGISHFMVPLGFYSPYTRVGAEANGDGVRYFTDVALDARGAATYSHEMTHLLDRTVIFNQNGRRDGSTAEFYARGMFENSANPEKDTHFNLNMMFDESHINGYYNQLPTRFQSAEDLKDYLHGSFDVLYSLDYVEAQAALALTTKEKSLYFKQMVPIPSKGDRTPVSYSNPALIPTHLSEVIKPITEGIASQLTDVHSLIDHHILVNRYIRNGFDDQGIVKAEGYYTVDMFDTIYGVQENSQGMSGDISFRKQAFELLAALGYNEGFLPYISNQLKAEAEGRGTPLSDTFIFSKILNGQTYATFKKAQMDERIAKLSQLKPIDIVYKGKTVTISSAEKLQELMKEAVREELAQIQAGQTKAKLYMEIETPVQALKKAIYKAYLRQSDDFRQSIYGNSKRLGIDDDHEITSASDII